VRKVAAHAYQNGCRLVTVSWFDEQLDKVRYQYAPRDSFEEYLGWRENGVVQHIEQGDALLHVTGKTPDLLKDQDSDLIAKVDRVYGKNFKPIYEHQGKNTVQWSVAGSPTMGWAAKVFPADSPQDGEMRLLEAVFKASHLNEPDPVAFWRQEMADLDRMKEHLTSKRYTALQFSGPGTDLKVGLPSGHIWMGGNIRTRSGITFLANIPTKEVFTFPHKDKVDGMVTATKPLTIMGSLVENFNMTFSGCKVVEFSAERGEEILRKVLETDEQAKFLGEVALIPHTTPISQMGILFWHSLYDENASNHLALGSAYQFCLEGGAKLPDEEFMQAGGNISQAHADFMIGSDEMDVDGIREDGTTEAVMYGGEWAFDV